jgi:hypothetical protein
VYVRRGEENQKQKSKIMLSMIEQVKRERPNQYSIGPQPARSPSWGIRDQKVRMKQRRGENKCFKCGDTGYSKRECPEGKRV